MKKLFAFLCFLLAALGSSADTLAAKRVYVFPIREDIMPATSRLVANCLREAREGEYDLVVIDMNTYGGIVSEADTIRTAILNFPKPVYVFVNNQAVSAGALISLAADSIFMRRGATIGAATVVNQTGEAMPDKYQSFMRTVMRSTAEAHGRVLYKITGSDTTWRWFRDPCIAEAMVDPSVTALNVPSRSGGKTPERPVEALSDSSKVLTLTADEAYEWFFCEGETDSVEGLLAMAGITEYEIHRYESTWMDKLMGFLTNPAFQGVLIMLIIGGIYFELQTPGVGFPLIVAITAAVLYFSPLYVEGLLSNWEVVVFVIGIILILIEIFAIPGFGVTGILGIVAMVTGLSFAAVDKDLLPHVTTGEISVIFVVKPVCTVIISVAAAIILSIWLGRKFLVGESRLRQKVVLTTDMTAEAGYVSNPDVHSLVGSEGITTTALRPSGRVNIDGRLYEATGENGAFIEKGVRVVVVRDQTGILYCREA